MYQAESSRDTVQRRKNSSLRDAFVVNNGYRRLWNDSEIIDFYVHWIRSINESWRLQVAADLSWRTDNCVVRSRVQGTAGWSYSPGDQPCSWRAPSRCTNTSRRDGRPARPTTAHAVLTTVFRRRLFHAMSLIRRQFSCHFQPSVWAPGERKHRVLPKHRNWSQQPPHHYRF